MLFLDQQRLDPTPPNYTLAYCFVTSPGTSASREIAELLGDGLRLTQEAADDIISRHGLGGSGAAALDPENAAAALRHQMLRLADITSSQSIATAQFQQGLSAGMARIGGGFDDLSTIISSMIALAANAERDLAAAAVETDRLRQDLDAARTDANIDALTRLPNRRAIDAILSKLEEANVPRTLAFCDIDRFKRINDNHGHAAGDRVLAAVAKVLGDACHGKAVVARWGGEEFVAVFEHMAVGDAAVVLESARRSLAQKRFKVRETDEPLGIVSFSAGVAGGIGPNSVISAAADARLYRAKKAGRNMIISAGVEHR
ncbi:diguanylate cyclase [Novosphingobium chloroacetimidivorans]|uniref:diguanylate cyclase n=1 Tax=Novosphingobium chloroacetimidivorans TaxID=1428314 RepID=A0A7W7NXZ3_9SPHN|nr:GGDEF domain-containing protein [Novosphingobium chloroacetimidivorans]MBB4860901.1 diguanylate cyclase [Novosphingobium chloroacetimidivorans]